MKTISTEQAPAAVGPYSQAKIHNGVLYTSGQIPLDPSTGKMVSEDITEQSQQVMKNLVAIIEAAGASVDDVIKTTCFLADINDFAAFNKVYAEAFGAVYPARSCFQVGALPLAAKVEVEAIVAVK
ncbi:RidA family protein [Paraferrimonas haliotis]|uniref:Endoribonuclease L-PSP n=1 Tax=Paraferrimonas haliotis TaxID=2013866 RepID=A0AA37WW91_9GAMM|nr:RidA family protein [Paraferrimonas haliotis]GLS82039.1 endoribonuclease L-PSP [Paraferrimonas haliotis]